jgi:hypothetical protein
MNICNSSVLVVSSLFIFSSCLENSKATSKKEAIQINQNETVEADGSNVQGNYAADIWPVNYNLHFKTIGTVGVKREGDTFSAMVSMKYGPKETRIKQAIYTARRCPNINDDLNKDAYIDILEARLAIGKITIPFDGDLDSQLSGSDQYPYVDGTGRMAYSKTASFSRLFADLKAPDETPADQMIKLGEEEGITLPGRIVIFQGMPKKVPLPESVATTDGEDKYDSIPVGCAVLWRVPEMPQEFQAIP